MAARYSDKRTERKQLAVWKPNRKARFMRVGETLRFQADKPFRVHWSPDGWKSVQDSNSMRGPLQIEYVDLNSFNATMGATIQFTLYWLGDNCWEGQDYSIAVR